MRNPRNEFLGEGSALNVKSKRERSLMRKKHIAGEMSNLVGNARKRTDGNKETRTNVRVHRDRFERGLLFAVK